MVLNAATVLYRAHNSWRRFCILRQGSRSLRFQAQVGFSELGSKAKALRATKPGVGNYYSIERLNLIYGIYYSIDRLKLI